MIDDNKTYKEASIMKDGISIVFFMRMKEMLINNDKSRFFRFIII